MACTGNKMFTTATKSIRAGIPLVFFLFAMLGCPNGTTNDTTPAEPDDHDYDSGYSIQVDNKSTERLVAFKGDVETNSLIGLIPASATEHGLPKDEALFSESGEFILKLITEKNYLAFKDGDLSKAPVYTAIYAFYNANTSDTVSFKISGSLGGNSRVDISNTTSFNIELREGGPQGEILAYIPPNTQNFPLYLSEGDYDFIAMFKKYSTLLKEVIEVYPKASNGKIVVNSLSLTPSGNQALTYDDNYIGTMDFTPNAAYITFQNQITNTGVYIRAGTEVLFTPTGKKVVNPNDSLAFQIDMTETGGIVGTSKTISNLIVISGSFQEQLPSFEYSAGSIYEVNITGDAINGITLGNITKTGEVNVSTLFPG